MEEPKISTKPITENRSSYRGWVAREGIPIIEGFFIEDIRKVPVEPWERTGGLTARICLEGTGETNDAYVCEIPPGKALKPQRHLFEELIYIVSGRGATTVWNDAGSKHTFEWQEGSVFSPPLNSWYQHFNGDGAEPARYLAVTTAPCMINLLHNTISYSIVTTSLPIVSTPRRTILTALALGTLEELGRQTSLLT